ncbi:hypothetical protein ACA910_019963 [Epithemia clementina (nom. ined.)]
MNDLDAFFEDVDKVAEEAVVEDEGDHQAQPPPSKRIKTASDDDDEHKNDDAPKPVLVAPPVRPRGVVVAAASSYKAPPPPPPPPPRPPRTGEGPQSSYSSHGTAITGWDNAEVHSASLSVGPTDVYGGPYTSHSGFHATTNGSHNQQQNSVHNSQQQLSAHVPSMTTALGAAVGTAQQIAGAASSKHVRTAGGKTWVDPSLDEWPENDFRIFVGNLASDVNDAALYQHFTKYASLQRARVVRDHAGKKKGESKGYGFVSFGDALDCAKAIREMDQTWLGSRPIRIKRSTWKDRELKQVKKTEQKHKNHQKKMRLL